MELDYAACERIMDEDSDETHPNIEQSTLKRWKRDRKKQVIESIEKRRQEIEQSVHARGCKSMTEEEKAEIERIKHITRKRIVEKRAEIRIGNSTEKAQKSNKNTNTDESGSACSIVTLKADKSIEKEAERVVDVIAQTEDVYAYIEYITRCDKCESVKKYVESILASNIRSGCKEAAKRICAYLLAHAVVATEQKEEITQRTVQMVKQCSIEYYNEVAAAILSE